MLGRGGYGGDVVEVRECWGEVDMEGMWWRLESVGERMIWRECGGG